LIPAKKKSDGNLKTPMIQGGVDPSVKDKQFKIKEVRVFCPLLISTKYNICQMPSQGHVSNLAILNSIPPCGLY